MNSNAKLASVIALLLASVGCGGGSGSLFDETAKASQNSQQQPAGAPREVAPASNSARPPATSNAASSEQTQSFVLSEAQTASSPTGTSTATTCSCAGADDDADEVDDEGEHHDGGDDQADEADGHDGGDDQADDEGDDDKVVCAVDADCDSDEVCSNSLCTDPSDHQDGGDDEADDGDHDGGDDDEADDDVESEDGGQCICPPPVSGAAPIK